MNRAFYTVKELAEHLAVPISTVNHWRLHGIGPVPFKFGRSIRYRLGDVEAWIEAQRQERSGNDPSQPRRRR